MSDQATETLTAEQALERLRAIRMDQEQWRSQPRGRDEENDHLEADAILCQLLRGLGLTDVAAAFEAIRKWYA